MGKHGEKIQSMLDARGLLAFSILAACEILPARAQNEMGQFWQAMIISIDNIRCGAWGSWLLRKFNVKLRDELLNGENLALNTGGGRVRNLRLPRVHTPELKGKSIMANLTKHWPAHIR
jgi:hypothetical protein